MSRKSSHHFSSDQKTPLLAEIDQDDKPIHLLKQAAKTHVQSSDGHQKRLGKAHWFGSHYLKHEYYFDVHPPLAKLLVALSGYLADYDGSFDFASGSRYPDINYKFMRQFNAMFGVVMVPLAYFTAREFRLSTAGCTFAATMVLLDNAYLTISRFILLDSMLLSATCLTLFCLSKFKNQRENAFSFQWWLWLTMTGVAIGTVSSMKWVGFFATALVGLYTIEELWDLLGDLCILKSTYLMHWIARALCLIALPFGIYVACFVVHFKVLDHSGPGDASMDSLFQASLKNNPIANNPLEVAYGSVVTIKHTAHNGALLHSHIQTLPVGSKQQQVTTYSHKDDNNHWKVMKPLSEIQHDESDEIQFVRDGDIIRLVHSSTGRNLHSHTVKAPITTTQWEVSGYGNLTHGDPNDEWVIEIVGERSTYPKDGKLRSLTTTFLLRHRVLGCLLTADSKVRLPEWGFGQGEVQCDQRNRKTAANSIWNIEQHWNDKLEPAPPSSFKTRFWDNFWTLNLAMMKFNNDLLPDLHKNDHIASFPSQWPMLAIGMRMNGWGDKQLKFYLVGNPIVWWSSTLSLVAFVCFFAYYSTQQSRLEAPAKGATPHQSNNDTQASDASTLENGHTTSLSTAEWDHFCFMGKTLIGGWFLHYLPFCIMGRVTYLHHYFPALYFTILLCSYLVDHGLRRASTLIKIAVWSIAFSSVIATFVWFWPASYGITDSANNTMKGRQWRGAWNIVDDITPRTFI
ncbi:Protein O-mannosyltransferase 2 [Podila epigama]|nr:Protein O-mannosyltransferase 2 [Podila epigama]